MCLHQFNTHLKMGGGVWLFTYCALFFLTVQEILAYNQTDYVLLLERVDTVSYDKHYIKHMTSKTFKFNRTSTAINFTLDIIQNLGEEVKVQLQAYRFASNEYREFPLRLLFDICDTLNKTDNWGIRNIYDCGNFTKCPFTEGLFIICNWLPDYSKFPPYIPGGRYKTELTLIYRSKEIGVLQAYTEIRTKNPWD